MLSCAGLQYSLKAFPKQSQKILESEILEPATIGMCRVIYRKVRFTERFFGIKQGA